MPLKCCYGLKLLNPSKGVIGLSKEVVYDLVEGHKTAEPQSFQCPVFEPGPPREQRFTIQIAKT